MKLKYHEVQSLYNAFKGLNEVEGNFTLPSQISYHLHKNRCRIEDKWHQLEKERKQEMTSMIEIKDGQPVVKKNKAGQETMVIKDQKAFEKMFENYKAKVVTVGIRKIPFEDQMDGISGEHEALQHF